MLTIMIALKQVIEAYETRGFKIRHILGDRQFKHATHRKNGNYTKHHQLGRTCPRNRKIHHNSKRKSVGYSQYIAF